ncbi:hypothetical protein VQL36_20340 [Chengkuizengella sp. SCS-71B]|uniref:hypothetical protein n=1 Tax=Chengkuizengella sp. SCS-71B TaxID=3115290 RepID=UPI0032C2399E
MEGRTWSREFTNAVSVTDTHFFGQHPHPYDSYYWGFYKLVGIIKTDYATSTNFKLLDDVFSSDIPEFGLTLNKTYVNVANLEVNYIEAVEMSHVADDLYASYYPTINTPTNFQVSRSAINLTLTFTWDASVDEDIDGYFILKDGEILGKIHGRNQTEFIEYGVVPYESHNYTIRSYSLELSEDAMTGAIIDYKVWSDASAPDLNHEAIQYNTRSFRIFRP